MIAALPTAPPDPKAPDAGKAAPVAASGKSSGATPAAPTLDFSALIARILSGAPGETPKTAGKKDEKSVKSTKAGKADPSADTAAEETAPPVALPLVLEPVKLDFGSRQRPDAETSAPPDAMSPDLPAPPADAVKPKTPQATAAPLKSVLEPATKDPPKTSGTTAASKGNEVKPMAQQNEFAEAATQKLPISPSAPISSDAPKASATSQSAPTTVATSGASVSETATISSASAVKAAPTGKVRLSVDFPSRDSTPQPISLVDSPKGLARAPAPAAPVAVAHLAPVDRVEQLIAREVVTFKQTGAEEVGVSLKIDANTQLFLQLSYRDGQTQAVLRCEKGDLPALSAHFGQLQESLARQNIQLQPASGGTGLGGENASSRRHPFQSSAQDGAATLEDARPPQPARKPKTRTYTRQGWESWA